MNSASGFARSPTAIAGALAMIVGIFYLRWTPLVPDLAAQVARADVVRTSGLSSWWTGWFGGLSLPSYSVLTPGWMAVIGVRTTGVVSVLAATLGCARLVKDAPRPRAGAIAFALAAMANLVDGRITFCVGLAFAVWSLVALRSNRGPTSAILALTTFLASPLAGLFLGLVLVAVVIVDRRRRRLAVASSILLLAAGGTTALLFPSAGMMPVDLVSLLLPAGYLLAVWLLCPQPVVRLSVALTLVGFVAFLVYPGAVGSNITRIAWLFPVVAVAAYARAPMRHMVIVAAVLLVWPLADLTGQLRSSFQPSAQAAYYTPLLNRIASEVQVSGGADVGLRTEVIDSANHWASVYLSSLSLARGWDRQADRASNPMFYGSDLTAATYRSWLDQLAVGWVAVPATTSLDFASKDEARLVQSGLPYLTVDWANRDWTLYRVHEPTPLAVGARVRAVGPAGIELEAPGPGFTQLRVRWSPYLTVVTPSEQPVAACVLNRNGWVELYLPAAGPVVLTSHFQPTARLHPQDEDCPSAPGSS